MDMIDTKQAYIDKAEGRLEQMKGRVKELSADARLEADRYLNQAQAQINELKKSGENNWEQLKNNLEQTWQKLQKDLG